MKKTYFYLPGSNANVVTLRREAEYDEKYHGSGSTTDIDVPVDKAFTACLLHDELISILKKVHGDLDESHKLKHRIAGLIARAENKCRDCNIAPAVSRFDRCDKCQDERDEYYIEKVNNDRQGLANG